MPTRTERPRATGAARGHGNPRVMTASRMRDSRSNAKRRTGPDHACISASTARPCRHAARYATISTATKSQPPASGQHPCPRPPLEQPEEGRSGGVLHHGQLRKQSHRTRTGRNDRATIAGWNGCHVRSASHGTMPPPRVAAAETTPSRRRRSRRADTTSRSVHSSPPTGAPPRRCGAAPHDAGSARLRRRGAAGPRRAPVAAGRLSDGSQAASRPGRRSGRIAGPGGAGHDATPAGGPAGRRRGLRQRTSGKTRTPSGIVSHSW